MMFYNPNQRCLCLNLTREKQSICQQTQRKVQFKLLHVSAEMNSAHIYSGECVGACGGVLLQEGCWKGVSLSLKASQTPKHCTETEMCACMSDLTSVAAFPALETELTQHLIDVNEWSWVFCRGEWTYCPVSCHDRNLSAALINSFLSLNPPPPHLWSHDITMWGRNDGRWLSDLAIVLTWRGGAGC